MMTDPQWHRIGKYPHHGIVVALASLRSQNGCGIGEFLDLLPLIPWCRSIGLDVIQLLPLNDSGEDPSPYNPISSCALDPVYLSLSALPNPHESLDSFAPFMTSQHTQFTQVKHQKLQWLKHYFEHNIHLLTTKEYQQFLQDHPWVYPYARFRAYKDLYNNSHWKDWPGSLPEQSGEFYTFVQYLCYRQMHQVRQAADAAGLFLKGDLSILISPDSADVWSERELFHLELVAGAPPDQYNQLGQKWGFPLFNWQAMEQNDYRWWKRRLKVAEEYFHIYRIDHIVGFFRIWAIPPDKKATEGHFIPSDAAQWPDHGRKILEVLIQSSSLLPIGEDLGTIPPFVPHILKELGICGTKVMRWQRDWHHSYIPFDHYEPLSLTTVSTHDLEPLGLWWQKFHEEAQSFAHFKHWTYAPVLSAGERFDILKDSHHTASLFHINLLQETLALFPELVWPNPEDERINIPGEETKANWVYRYRPYVEEIVSHAELQDAFAKIVHSHI